MEGQCEDCTQVPVEGVYFSYHRFTLSSALHYHAGTMYIIHVHVHGMYMHIQMCGLCVSVGTVSTRTTLALSTGLKRYMYNVHVCL